MSLDVEAVTECRHNNGTPQSRVGNDVLEGLGRKLFLVLSYVSSLVSRPG